MNPQVRPRSIPAGLLALALLHAPAAAIAQPAGPPSGLPPAVQWIMDRGIAAAQQGDFSTAHNNFMAAWSLEPEAPQIWLDLGLADSRIPGYELRAICWFKLYLMKVPDAPNATAVREQIAALDAAFAGRLRATVNRLEPLLALDKANRPIESYAANVREAVLHVRMWTGWDLASARYALGDITDAEQGLRRTNGDGWRRDWQTAWQGAVSRNETVGNAEEPLVVAIAASGRLDQAADMLGRAYDAKAVEFMQEQGGGAAARRLSAGRAGPPVTEPCTPAALAEYVTRWQPSTGVDGCAVGQWWSTGRETFLLRTALKGVEVDNAHDEIRLPDYLRAANLDANGAFLNSVTSRIAALALEYRKVRGPAAVRSR